MSKVFLYSRVSTSQQTLEQQERTVYEWLNAHNMKVDEVISDEGVSGGVSYVDRNLGKVLLPKTHEGDLLIVSEVSRLGRSMFDLSKLIHTELKPRKLRLVIVGMGVDLNCAKITPIDQLLLSNFSFAAELEKHLIRERTLSALAVRKQKGIKLGAASEKYRNSYNNKSKEIKEEESMRRGEMKRERYLSSRDVQAFLRILRNLFPDACESEDCREWIWKKIRTGGGYRAKIYAMMKDYAELDGSGTLFARWKFDTWTEDDVKPKLLALIQRIRESVLGKTRRENV